MIKPSRFILLIPNSTRPQQIYPIEIHEFLIRDSIVGLIYTSGSLSSLH